VGVLRSLCNYLFFVFSNEVFMFAESYSIGRSRTVGHSTFFLGIYCFTFLIRMSMAKYVHGINGPLAGSLGNLVASNWRGIPYLKTKPKRKKAFTGNELRNQGSFGMTTQWLRPLTDHLRAGFKGDNPRKWGFNGAKSYLHAHALTREGNSKVIDPSKVLISQGNLPLGTEFEMHFDEETFEVTVRWNTHAPRARKGAIAAADDDKLMLAVYDPEAGEVFGDPYGVSRKRGMEQVELPLGLVATYHVYVAFVAADGSSRSDSLYLGAIRVGEEEDGEEQKPET
jgi:hypothetical protein